MKCLALIRGLATSLLLSAVAIAEINSGETQKIPLNQIWALSSPGTRRIRELEPSPEDIPLSHIAAIRESLVLQIQHALSERLDNDESAGSAFVVEGTGKEALSRAAAILSSNEQPRSQFRSNVELTLVFFSHICGEYVWVDSVERSERRITVNYRFVSRRTADSATQFALIPLGKLESGEIQVEINQLPPLSLHKSDQPVFIPDLERVVCKSFSFRVVE